MAIKRWSAVQRLLLPWDDRNCFSSCIFNDGFYGYLRPCFMPCSHLFKSSELGFFPNVIVSGKV